MKIFGLLTLFFSGGGGPAPAAANPSSGKHTQLTRVTARTGKT